MSGIHGKYYPVGNSDSKPATLRFTDDKVFLRGEDFEQVFAFAQAEISDRLANVPRRVEFVDGSLFSTSENAEFDQLLIQAGRRPKASVFSFFETGWHWALLAVALLPLALYLLFTIGMPFIAKPLAQAVPESVKDHLDTEIVSFLDKKLMQPSGLSQEMQDQMTSIFDNSFWTRETHLEFRKGGELGANALALPGGTIIITDELVKLIEFDGEFYAVMAHEVGHVVGNHSMQNVVRVTGVSMVLGWMFGDLSFVTDMVLVGLPTLLQQMSYSRRFENEADQYAIVVLKQTGFPGSCFSSLMAKLGKDHNLEDSAIPSYLSSHPTISSRIKLARSRKPCMADDDQISWSHSNSELPETVPIE